MTSKLIIRIAFAGILSFSFSYANSQDASNDPYFISNNSEEEETIYQYKKLINCPSQLVVTPQNECGDYQLTLGEGQPGEDVYWYFADGTYDDHVTYSILHHYSNDGSYAGYAQYTSDLCETTTYNFFIIVPNCFDTSIQETEKPKISIYPNPSNNYLYLKNLTEKEIESVKIINQIGEVVFETNNLHGEISKISTQNIPSGIYQLITHNTNDYRSVTISINH